MNNSEDLRIVIVRGLPFTQSLQANTRATVEGAETPVDITAWEIESDAKYVNNDQEDPPASAPVDFSFTVTKPTPATGYFNLTLTAATTEGLTGSRAKFDIVKRNSSGSDWELYATGVITIKDKITEI